MALSLALVIAVVSSAAAADVADAAAVAIRDASLEPSRITIGPGESVTWINSGASAHTVKSDTRAWPPFTVAPGASSREVPFRRTGVYRYRVDGRLRGTVVVAARLAPGAGGGGGSGDGTKKRVFRYSVTVKAEIGSKSYITGNPGAGGRIVQKGWTMRFRDVRVVVSRFPGVPVQIGLPGNGTRGSVDAHFRYRDDERFTPEDHRPVCDIAGNYPNMAATFSLSGSAKARRTPGTFALYANHDQGVLANELAENAANEGCPERQPGSPFTHGSDLGPIDVRGATLVGTATPADFRLVREWKTGTLKAPLDDLIRGRRLIHYKTGLRTQILVSSRPSPAPVCPDPRDSCSVDELSKQLEITLRRR